MSEHPGQIGKYRILKEIGRGATATVYLAENPHYPEPVALKYVRFKDKALDEAKWNRRLIKLFKAEGSVAGRLDHPNIIHVFESVIKDDEAYVVMEYFPGETLERFCSFENMMPVHRAIGIVFKCCMALDYAFRQGVVHRDIKPANILIDANDEVKITDFGLALNINKKMQTDSTFVMGVGSPAYMSPEQIKNYPLNQKTDLYSLGVVLFHLLTGRLPFRASNPAQLIYKILNADPPLASQLNPDLPEQIDNVLRKALEKDLYSRYRNGADFAKDLSAVRYKIVDDRYVPPDTSRFSVLRRLAFFEEFDDVELWEVMRISTWRTVAKESLLFREGDADQRFGIVLDGRVELSIEGRRVSRMGAGEIFGELAWLDGASHRHVTTCVAIEATTYLEINPAALALATEEVQSLFRDCLATLAAKRLGAALRELAKDAEPAVRADFSASGGLDLQLVED
ncbi:MAG: protein kinase [Rhodocyclaceae bacterium]|jgi:non-specific serine/threonine protein kinase|nr:protein kinase [Rhodocyclaceae bacterium]